MRLKKLLKMDDNYLKDYLILVNKIPSVPHYKLELILNKLKNTKDKREKKVIKKFLIESFLKYVIPIANKYRGAGFSFATLIKFGNKGLIEAIKKFLKEDIQEDIYQYVNWIVEGEILKRILINKNKKLEKVK